MNNSSLIGLGYTQTLKPGKSMQKKVRINKDSLILKYQNFLVIKYDGFFKIALAWQASDELFLGLFC